MARERSRSRSSYSYSSYSYSSEHRPSKATSRKEDKGGLAGESKASEAAPASTNGEKPAKVKEPQARSGTGVASAVQQETKVALDNLQEMLAARQRELAKETSPDRRKDIEKDIEILKQWQAEGVSKISSADKSTPIKAVSAGEHAKAKENESRRTSKAESKGKASKAEAKVVKEPKEKPKKGKTSTEKAQGKQAKEPKLVTKAEKASKKAPSGPSNEVKQKSKGDKAAAKAAPTDKHEAAQGSAKQKEEKKNHTTEEATAKKAEKSAAPESPKRKKDKKENAANVKEVPEQVEPKHAETKENPRDKLLQSAEMIEQAKEALRHLKQKAAEAEAVPAVPQPGEMLDELPAEDGAEQPLMEDKVTVLMPSEKVPPCELPLWCVMPNLRDVETVFDIVRVVSGSAGPPKRLQLGRRSWALLGRRLHEAQAAEARRAGVPEPDIGLACPLSSKAHALVLQNWTGKIFLQDLGSAHGTFLGGVRLKPHEPCEWRPGVQVCFADSQLEFFELRVAEK